MLLPMAAPAIAPTGPAATLPIAAAAVVIVESVADAAARLDQKIVSKREM